MNDPLYFAHRRHAMRYQLGLPPALRKNVDRDYLIEMLYVARKRKSPLLYAKAFYYYGLSRLFGARHWKAL